MHPLTGRVARAFARSSASYRDAALAQKQIAAKLFEAYRRVAPDHHPTRMLEAGYGTGQLTEHLLRLRPTQLWLNDLNSVALPGVDAVYLPGDIAEVGLPVSLDLAASASMIQWVNDPAWVLTRLCDAVAPGGYLALSGFSPAHFPELRALGSQGGAPSYMTGEAMAALLPPDWQVRELGAWRIPCHFPEALAVLKHLRATGVNACAGQLRTPGAMRDFLTRYESAYRGEQGVLLTYVASWLVAVKHG